MPSFSTVTISPWSACFKAWHFFAAHTFSVWPFKTVYATGQGFKPLTWLYRTSPGLDQSISSCSRLMFGAYVAFCSSCFSGVTRARAAEIDAAVARGEDPGPLAGVPVGVKELAQAEGFPNTHASVVFRDDVAEGDCPEVAGLRAAGAVITGLTTAPEWGIPSYTASPLHGITRNPWNPGAHAGRLVGRVRRRGRGRAVPRVHRERRWRVDPHPVVVLRPAGDEAHVRPDRPRPVRPVRHRAHVRERTDRAFRPRRGPLPRRDERSRALRPDVARRSPTRTSRSWPTSTVRGTCCAASGSRGRRRSGTPRPTATSRPRTLATAEALIDAAGLELVDVPIAFPKPGRAWGVLERREHCGLVLRPVGRGARRPRHAGPRLDRGAPAPAGPPPRRRDPSPAGDPRRVGRALRAGRPAAHAPPRPRPRTRRRARSSARSTARSAT